MRVIKNNQSPLADYEFSAKPWRIFQLSIFLLLPLFSPVRANDLSTNTTVRILESFGDPTRIVARPLVQLATDEQGNSFGIYPYEGSHGCGALVRIEATPESYRILHYFGEGSAGDGCVPNSLLYDAASRRLFGTTAAGTIPGGENGTLYEVNTDGGGYRILGLFSRVGAVGGVTPTGQLTLHPDRNIYGIARQGGVQTTYWLFRWNHASSELEMVHELDLDKSGGGDAAGLTATADGLFLTRLGSWGAWLVKLSLPDFKETPLWDFSNIYLESPTQAPVWDPAAGLLIGCTQNGGRTTRGTIYTIRSPAAGSQTGACVGLSR